MHTWCTNIKKRKIISETYLDDADDDDDGERGIGGDATTTDLLTDGARDRDKDNVEKAFPIDIPAGDDRPLKKNQL